MTESRRDPYVASSSSRSGSRPAQNAGERLGERLRAQHPRLALVQDAEAGIEPRLERVRLQEPVAEPVDGRDPGALDVAGEIDAAELDEPLADPCAQLAGGALRVGDDEDALEPQAAVGDRADEALDQHGRLPGSGARGDEDDARLVDRGLLLGIGRPDAHARFTRHIGQRSHHVGHVPPRGSCSHVARPDARDGGLRALDGAVDVGPELRVAEVVLILRPRDELGGGVEDEPARLPRARERPVEPAERLDADEVAQREDVERHLELPLGLDLPRRVRARAGLVVLDDPARAHRVLVDPVDLPGDGEAAQVEAALQLDGRALRPERHLEAARDERRADLDLLADEPLEVAAERSFELQPVELGEVEPHLALDRAGQALLHELDRLVEAVGVDLIRAEALREPRVEAVERLVGDAPADARVELGVDRARVDHAVDEPHGRARREGLELGDGEAPLLHERRERGAGQLGRPLERGEGAVDPPLPAVGDRERPGVVRLVRAERRRRRAAVRARSAHARGPRSAPRSCGRA